MEVIVIDSKAYNALLNEMREIIKSEFMILREKGIRENDWVSPDEARKLLGIGKTKFFEIKSEGKIIFSQHGRKVKVSRKSIEEYLNQGSSKRKKS